MKYRMPTCPHCGHALSADEMYEQPDDLWALAPKEETSEAECPRCEKIYFIQGGYTPFYECSKEDPN